MSIFGRGRRTRTHDPWFWRPVLYQLSYTPSNIGIILNIASFVKIFYESFESFEKFLKKTRCGSSKNILCVHIGYAAWLGISRILVRLGSCINCSPYNRYPILLYGNMEKEHYSKNSRRIIPRKQNKNGSSLNRSRFYFTLFSDKQVFLRHYQDILSRNT